MAKKTIFLKLATFPNPLFYFFKTDDERFCVFGGIVDYKRGKTKKIPGSLCSKDLHKTISEKFLNYKSVEKVSFYGGGIDILLKEELDKNRVKYFMEKTLKEIFPNHNVIIL